MARCVQAHYPDSLREDAMTAAIFVISINLLLVGSLAIRDR